MKKVSFLFLIFLPGICSHLLAQVEIDRSVSMTGGVGERSITNLELPINDADAANKAYVDAAVAAGGGGQPTMISDESATSMNFGAALRYCKQLSEGGHTDWFMPTKDALHYVLSKGGISVSNNTSTNTVWFSSNWQAYGGSSWDTLGLFKLSDGTYSFVTPYSASNAYVRCVR